MIDVPARVKDALKSGDYKKNYKIIVPDMVFGDYLKSNEVAGETVDPSTGYYYAWIGWSHIVQDQWGHFDYFESAYAGYYFVLESYSKFDVEIYAAFDPSEIVFEVHVDEDDYTDFVISEGRTYITINDLSVGRHNFSISLKSFNEHVTPYMSEFPIHFLGYQTKNWIDNNNLVAESVKFDERMCSDSELKFGLCEGTSVEFQYFDLPNIREHRINVELEIEFVNTREEFQPRYRFSIDTESLPPVARDCHVSEYGIYKVYIEQLNAFNSITVWQDETYIKTYVAVKADTETYVMIDKLSPDVYYTFEFAQLNLEEGTRPFIKIDKIINIPFVDWYTIPMGWYDVDECSRQASTGIIKAVAYNKLKSNYLDADATSKITQMILDNGGDPVGVVTILDKLLTDYAFNIPNYEYIGRGAVYDLSITGDDNPTGSIFRIFTESNIPYDGASPARGFAYGTYFQLYHATFYYVPLGVNTSTTTDYYKYTIDFTKIWNAISHMTTTFAQDLQPLGISGDVDVFYSWSYTLRDLGSIQNYFPWESPYAPGYVRINNRGVLYIGQNKNNIVTTDEFTGEFPYFDVTILITCDSRNATQNTPSTNRIKQLIESRAHDLSLVIYNADAIKIYKRTLNPIEQSRIGLDDLSNSVSLRDLQSAVFEVDCQYGKLDRVSDLFSGIELNQGMLFPRDDLYPADDLFPQGIAEAGYPAMYSKLWADEGNVRSFRYLYVTYKTTENNETVEKVMQKTVNANGTDDYNMSDNWLFKNIVWSTADVSAYADAMVAKMRGIKWFPFEMWCVGLPYIEAGDIIEIAMKNGTYPSPVLRRNLNGIQNLQDEMINGTLDIF